MKRGHYPIFALAATLLCCLLLSACSKEVQNEEISIDFCGEQYHGSFTGTLEKALPMGEGTFQDEHGWTYKGSFLNGYFSGNGTLTDYPLQFTIASEVMDGIYSGSVTDFKPNGDGAFQGTTGCSYIGKFENGRISEDGTFENLPYAMAFDHGSISGIYTGQWKNGLPEGAGIFEAAEHGMKYDGGFTGGTLSGEGTAVNWPITIEFQGLKHEGIYNGSLLDGRPNGSGNFASDKEKDPFRFDGTWNKELVLDAGHLETDIYTMNFDGFDKTGTFNGSIKDGIASGYGTFSAVNSQGIAYTYTGDFAENVFNGYGEEQFENEYNSRLAGLYTNGYFTPSVADGVASLGTAYVPTFTLSDQARKIIEDYEPIFIGQTDENIDIKQMVNPDLTFIKYIKQPDKYQNDLIYWRNHSVIQIYINKLWDTDIEMLTMITMDYSGNVCYVYALNKNGALGDLDIYEGTTVHFYGLPIGYSSYENVSGGITKCTIILASILEWN